jgi:hypothetical protein
MENADSIPIPYMNICNLPNDQLCGNGVTGKSLTQSMGLLPNVQKIKHKSPPRFRLEY